MAELTNKADNSVGSAKRLKHLPKVDLTAMVDLAFLLITFFMLTTTLSKPGAMNVAMPVGSDPQPISEKRTMTICLGKGDKLQWYMGTMQNPIIAPTVADYGAAIRRVLIEQSKQVLKHTNKRLIVLIKPSDKSKYKNLIDILDELDVTKVASYAIVNIEKPELDRMKMNMIY